MATPVALVALLGGWAAPGNETVPETPTVWTDYARALAEAARTNKPVVVFIGEVSAPLRQQLQRGSVPVEALQLLHERYVVVEISRQQVEGRALAHQFELTEGVVISSPGGQLQAYRHGGPWQVAQLLPQLRQYATAGIPKTTIYSGTANSPSCSQVVGATCTSCSSCTSNVCTTCSSVGATAPNGNGTGLASGGTCSSCTGCSTSTTVTYTPASGATCTTGSCSTVPVRRVGLRPVRRSYTVPVSSCPNGSCSGR
jgi:hypothetical protein